MRRIAWIAPTLLWWAACAPDFTPMSFVDKPRILGIVAEPPEVAFSEDAPGSVTLQAVVALPGPDRDGVQADAELTDLSWALCVLSLGAGAGYACAVPEFPVGDADLATRTAAFDGALLVAQMDLIRGFLPEYIAFLKQIVTQDDACTLAVIADWEACLAANGDDPAPCGDATFAAAKACMAEGGIELMFHATATVTVDGTPRTVDAYKRVAFRAPKEGREPNRNPGFRVRLGEAEVAATDGQGLGATVAVCPGAKITFEPELFEDAIERNPDAEPAADGTPAEEFLFLSWVATSGDFDRIKSSIAVVDEDDPIDLTNEWTAWEADEMPAESTAWVFARDDRLGVSYVTFPLVRWDGPECATEPDFAKVLDGEGGAP
jgi:hypothetical protein